MWPVLGHGLHEGTPRHIGAIGIIQEAALPGKGVESAGGLSQQMAEAARRHGREGEIGGQRAWESIEGGGQSGNLRIGWGTDIGMGEKGAGGVRVVT